MASCCNDAFKTEADRSPGRAKREPERATDECVMELTQVVLYARQTAAMQRRRDIVALTFRVCTAVSG